MSVFADGRTARAAKAYPSILLPRRLSKIWSRVLPVPLLLAVVPQPAAAMSSRPVLTLVQTVKLPDVKGGFDLMAVDITRHRLMLDAEDNDTMEVIDLDRGASLRSIAGMHAPKWVAYHAKAAKIYVANGDGHVAVLSAQDYAPIRSVAMGGLANNLRFSPDKTELFVGVGDHTGSIAVIDTSSDAVKATYPLDAFPKQFELDGPLLYANIPSQHLVQVLDTVTGQTVARWPVCSTGNVPMALDAEAHRLFIGCKGGQLQSLDTRTGRVVETVAISGETDGVWLDKAHRLIYVSAGVGAVDVLRRGAGDRIERIESVATVKGAATSLFAPSVQRLYVAVPQTAGQVAELRTYATP